MIGEHVFFWLKVFILRCSTKEKFFTATSGLLFRGAFDSAKNHKRQRRKRQSVTGKREKSQTPKFV